MDEGVLPGRSYPMGASISPGGVNFCVFSRHARQIDLLLFDRVEDQAPTRTIRLDPKTNRTFYYWHVFVPGAVEGQLYAYRADGPYNPAQGMRFDYSKVLVDPYARATAYGENYSRQEACHHGDNCPSAMKSVVVDARGYDWQGQAPLCRPYAGSVIYELHVGGFTQHPSSGVAPEKRGTYAGLVEKIPYLKELGVTAVELLPVQQFDPQDAPPTLSNYWGYSPIAFFAPHRGYSSRQDPLGPVYEFKDMVRALHQAGIEVIVDMVFNHTAEADHAGPTLSFRGLENRAYYILEQNDLSRYGNYSGCGNTLDCSHSIVRRMVLECLHYWVQVMHVDGVRFDLASVMSRDKYGQPLLDPPVLWEIESDPVLAATKIIAEAWDAAGLYQVGTFIGHRWAEWNGQYRDDVRSFVKSDRGAVPKLAQRITGSRDIYNQPDREPNRSINFITCHDGFTLNDLVSYNHKHNLANGYMNRDGADFNASWNCGVEGPTADPQIEALRERQIRNLMAILMVSQGTPMLLMGDEIRRTQGGNNNTFCQDNETSWFNWDDVERNAGVLRFFRTLIDFYKNFHPLQEEHFWTEPGESQITWHGVRLHKPDWGEASHSLAFELYHPEREDHLHVMLNAYWEPLEFEVPAPVAGLGRCWRILVDTAQAPPHDCSPPDTAPSFEAACFRLQPRSVVILLER